MPSHAVTNNEIMSGICAARRCVSTVRKNWGAVGALCHSIEVLKLIILLNLFYDSILSELTFV